MSTILNFSGTHLKDVLMGSGGLVVFTIGVQIHVNTIMFSFMQLVLSVLMHQYLVFLPGYI